MGFSLKQYLKQLLLNSLRRSTSAEITRITQRISPNSVRSYRNPLCCKDLVPFTKPRYSQVGQEGSWCCRCFSYHRLCELAHKGTGSVPWRTQAHKILEYHQRTQRSQQHPALEDPGEWLIRETRHLAYALQESTWCWTPWYRPHWAIFQSQGLRHTAHQLWSFYHERDQCCSEIYIKQ